MLHGERNKLSLIYKYNKASQYRQQAGWTRELASAGRRYIYKQGTHMKLLISTIFLLSTTAFANTSSNIEQVILDNLKHTQTEDSAAAMGDLHSQSPAYLATQQMLQQLFPAYDLQYELLSYKFIGEDDEYAYAKVKQRTRKISGPAFQNNEIEMLMIFKQENGVWKLWTQANLSISYI